ncbi:hypothetical protein WJX84_012457 [Apatococcus fuscideae]|uniref:DUF547 domain-containing protein n=1 Tax=Apatococcus fuscideae TaxID=2026836 RepID=A0AAW1TA98_9CHLO
MHSLPSLQGALPEAALGRPQQRPCKRLPGARPVVLTAQLVGFSKRRLLQGISLLGAGVFIRTDPAAASPPYFQELLPKAAVASEPAQKLEARTAIMLQRSVYDGLRDLNFIDEQDFQIATFRLRNQEYKYYLEQHRAEMPALPELSDNSGGLSNPAYFNFCNYILWKSAARVVPDDGNRAQLVQTVGRRLVDALAPDALDFAKQSASRGGGRAGPGDVQQALRMTLDPLQRGGYFRSYQLTWGPSPGLSDPTPQQLQQQLMQQAGSDAPIAPDQAASSPEASTSETFQVRLEQPADLSASVSLREEEKGFWSRNASSMLQAVLAAAGYPAAAADEFFFQNKWQGPSSLKERILLFLGDPLQQVGVPFNPTTLVQDWHL